jgi:DNA polymerase-3 subunit beta
MRFRCERDKLVDVLTTVSRGVSTRGGALPVLAGVQLKLEGNLLQLVTTDLDLSIQSAVEVQGAEDGHAVVPARLFTDIVKALEPGVANIDIGEDAQISSGKSQFSVRTLPANEFPRLPDNDGQAVTIDGATLVDGLRQVIRAASTNDDRPVLTGVLLTAEDNHVRIVATDSYRLALRDLANISLLSEGQKVLIPSKALQEIQRLSPEGEITVQLAEREVTFLVGDTKISTRLIDGEFPNYRQLIPDGYPNRLTVDRSTLLEAVRRVKLLVRDTMTPVRVALSGSGIQLTVVSQEIGQATEDVDAKYEGTEMTVAFNPTYLIDGIEALGSDEIILETVDSLKPALLRASESPEFLYLLMPVRVS